MKDILQPRHLACLMEFCRGAAALVFDYDGTLAPIVEDPDKARIRASTRRLLRELSGFYPCALVSGRSRRQLALMTQGITLSCLVGNHGMEWMPPMPLPKAIRRRVRRWERHLRRAFADTPGIRIEGKGLSCAVHYRQVSSALKPQVRERIFREAASFGRVRILEGKDVVDFMPPSLAHKGAALKRIRRLLSCDRALYVGDDTTDEDAFALRTPKRYLGIRVGDSRASKAAYCLPAQSDIDALLKALLSFRIPKGQGAHA